jgi:signal recognition particle GTPase
MEELRKVKRVLGRLDPGAPHEVLLVLDGGSGQNALLQARRFHEAVGITGIVITKLDGTAKGGIVLAIAREFGVPCATSASARDRGPAALRGGAVRGRPAQRAQGESRRVTQ